MKHVAAGVIASPALAIPFLGAGVASAYIKSIGENYADAVVFVMGTSTLEELNDSTFIARRVREESQSAYVRKREKRRERMQEKAK